MAQRVKTWWTVRALMHETQLPRRQLQALWRLGIVAPPGRGPGAGFDAQARARILEAVRYRQQGYTGSALKARFTKPPTAELKADLAKLSTWLRIAVAPGVELHVDLTRADMGRAEGLAKTLGAALSA